jgi:nitrogen fixation/metabolism regulation signal transduction histidine kinase
MDGTDGCITALIPTKIVFIFSYLFVTIYSWVQQERQMILTGSCEIAPSKID